MSLKLWLIIKKLKFIPSRRDKSCIIFLWPTPSNFTCQGQRSDREKVKHEAKLLDIVLKFISVQSIYFVQTMLETDEDKQRRGYIDYFMVGEQVVFIDNKWIKIGQANKPWSSLVIIYVLWSILFFITNDGVNAPPSSSPRQVDKVVYRQHKS